MSRREPSPKKKSSKKRRARQSGDSSEYARIRRAYREIVGWVRRQLGNELGDMKIPADLRLPIAFDVAPGTPGRSDRHEQRFIEVIEKEIHRARDELTLEELGYHPGHLRCHWCSSSICEHSLPPNPRAVFVGYDPTGTPRWRDFASWVVERRDPRLDRLYLGDPIPLAIGIHPAELTRDLLPEFERSDSTLPHYVIAAQLVAGLFQLPTRGAADRGIALTAQIVERRGSGGDPLYSLNLLSNVPQGHDLPTVVNEQLHSVLSPWLRGLASDVRDFERRQRADRREGRRTSIEKCRQQAEHVMASAEKQLEKYLRQDERRTQHATDRSQDPQRPTASALSDAFKASQEQLFWDRAQRTVIVRGPRNRIHVFKVEGTHVTSIVYGGRAIAERIQQGRWTALEVSLVEAFRAALTLRADAEDLGDLAQGDAQ